MNDINITHLIIFTLVIGIVFLIARLRRARRQIEMLTLHKTNLVPNPALNNSVNHSGEIARLRTVSQNYRAALADIHASTSKSKNGTAVMVTRKAAKALGLPEQLA